jgi:amidohydrolase
MSDNSELKDHIGQNIDSHYREIVEIGETIFRNPELGFKETETSALVQSEFHRLKLDYRSGLAKTGVKARIDTGKPGPTLALIGELDALAVPGHPYANPETQAAHACGHNAQIAGLIGAAIALSMPSVLRELSGSIVFMAVPAEECVEIEYRHDLVKRGDLEFMGGKAELIALGEFDDVDMAMMIHTHSNPAENGIAAVTESNNGCVVKRIHYIGRSAHAGAFPHLGINALYAAQIGISAINSLRETFQDEDAIRVHPIITHGGDLVNVIPANVTLETYVRGKTTDAIAAAAGKVDRALKAGALALGADVEIITLPGYLPLINNPVLSERFIQNQATIHGDTKVIRQGHRTGSTDMGDVSHIMPALHPSMAGAIGSNHAIDWAIDDLQMAFLEPAKALAWMAVDLLTNNAQAGTRLLNEFEPLMTKNQYLAYQRGISKTDLWSGDQLN